MPTVLLAEDSAAVRELLRLGLGRAGYDVLEAWDGEAAWELLQTEDVAALITDLHLPGRDGLSLLSAIRDHPRLRSLPVIVVTGDLNAEERATDAGADRVVMKPFSVSAICGAVTSATPARPTLAAAA